MIGLGFGEGVEGLERLPVDLDAGADGQIPPEHAARIRLHFLVGQCASYISQTQFADAKASAVLAFTGLVGARVAVEVDKAAIGPGEFLMFGVKALVLTLCLLIIFPRYPGAAQRQAIAAKERFSWLALSAPGEGADAYADYIRAAEAPQLLDSLARSNAAMAQVLARKFRFLRAAFALAVLDVILTVGYWVNAVGPAL